MHGYRNRHCEEGRSPDVAIQAIPNYIRDLTRLPRRDYVPPRNDGLYGFLSLKLIPIRVEALLHGSNF
ncbi:hypothetical protein [Rickettsia endosymbiont of Ceutorhynchus obstrictus]|uniref:hypothetical protein n=1 Tax=Rickettsia endosymbiont of Ceutorhynchus obstrictus TaxID=3066249 RepID=UPI0031330E14